MNITGQPKDGVYIKGMYLEGAGWDKKNCCLVEANAMQLVCEMPTIHFKPAELKKKTGMCGLFVQYLLQFEAFWIVRASKFNDRVVFSVWKSTSKAITLLNLFESRPV